MLPGMSGAVLGSGSLSALLIANLGNTTDSVTFPASGLVAGDIAIFGQTSRSATSSAPGAVTPSGFTQASNVSAIDDGGRGTRQIVAYKRLTGSEGGTTITGMPGGAISRLSMAIVRVSRVPSALTAVDPGASISAGVPTTQSVSVTGVTKPVLMCGYVHTASTPTISGTLTTSGVQVVSPVNSSWIYYEAQLYPEVRTLAVNDSGNYNGVAAFGLALDF